MYVCNSVERNATLGVLYGYKAVLQVYTPMYMYVHVNTLMYDACIYNIICVCLLHMVYLVTPTVTLFTCSWIAEILNLLFVRCT